MMSFASSRVVNQNIDRIVRRGLEYSDRTEGVFDIHQGRVEHDFKTFLRGDSEAPLTEFDTGTVRISGSHVITDVALDTADVVLMGVDLSKIPYVLGLGRKTRRTLTINLAIAFSAIALMVGTILLRGIPLPLAVVGHEGSTVRVSLNGLRLLGFRG